MIRKKSIKFHLKQFVRTSILVLALIAPLVGQADEILAKLAEAAAGRFFLTQTAEGTEIAARELGRPIVSQADYDELTSAIRANRISPQRAQVLDLRIRELDSRLTGDVESLSSEDLFAHVRPISEAAGIPLNERAAAGQLEFLPPQSRTTYAADSAAFLEGSDPAAARSFKRRLTEFDFESKYKVSAQDRPLVAELVKEYEITVNARLKYSDLIEGVFNKLAAQADASHEAALEAADKMAKLGESLDHLIEKLPVAEKRALRYKLADAVLTLESFKPSEFKLSETHTLTNKKVGYVHISDYPRYVEGFVNNTAPFTTHPFGQGSGVLSITDMRNIASLNEWPLELQPHDFKHVHYSLSHPRAAAVYFKSARSIDPLRFTLVSAMYEGVDTVQYTHERTLAVHFDTTMHMSLEEAMVWIAKAPKNELLALTRKLGIESSVQSYASQIEAWTPTYKAPYSPMGRGGKGLDADLDKAIKQFIKYAEAPEHQPYLRYNRRAKAGAAPMPVDDVPQH